MEKRIGSRIHWLMLLLVLAGCTRESNEAKAPSDDYVFEPSLRASAFIAMIERPEARQVMLLGKNAKALAPVFERAGVKVARPTAGSADIMFFDCGEMSDSAYAKALTYLAKDGVLAWWMDVSELTVGKFQERLRLPGLAAVHLWMPSERYWLLVGHRGTSKVRFASMLDIFTRESAFADLAKAGPGTMPELFANYVGLREEVLPAFKVNDAKALVRPEFFLTRAIPSVNWIAAEAEDADIVKSVAAEMRSMQLVRREVVEGNVLSRDAKDKAAEKAAVEKWNRAALRSPNDLFVLERLDRLDRNAQGFLSLGKILQAMKCYETMVLIKPTAASVHNFGMCLKKIGKLDLAKRVLEHAEALANDGARPAIAPANIL